MLYFKVHRLQKTVEEDEKYKTISGNTEGILYKNPVAYSLSWVPLTCFFSTNYRWIIFFKISRLLTSTDIMNLCYTDENA